MTENGWLQIDAGSEYDKNWERYFSQAEEERVTRMAEKLTPAVELLESARLWRACSTKKTLWIVIVLHENSSRILRGLSTAHSGRPYVETVLPWAKYVAATEDEQKAIILERLDTVFIRLQDKLVQ